MRCDRAALEATLVPTPGPCYGPSRIDPGRSAPGLRRGGRVVECTALEMRHGRKSIGGSNPSLSANQLSAAVHRRPHLL